MGNLDNFLSPVRGYLGSGNEDSFPWSATKDVWYLLLVVEDGKICRYGFTSAKIQKHHLKNALLSLDGCEALLLGVNYAPYGGLCALDIPTAIQKLDAP